MRAGLEALMSSSPGLAVAAGDPDVLVTAAPIEELSAGPPIVLLGEPAWSAQALKARRPRYVAAGCTVRRNRRRGLCCGGRSGISRSARPRGMAGRHHGAPVADTGPLTPREAEVLAMMSEGAANKTIAWKLNISGTTSEVPRGLVLAKPNAGTRAEAVALGVKRGLLLL